MTQEKNFSKLYKKRYFDNLNSSQQLCVARYATHCSVNVLNNIN